MSSQDRHLLSGRPSPGQLTGVPARYGPRHARDMGAGAGTADNWKPALRVRPGRHASPAEPLTGRETEVLGLLRGSLSTRGIAAELSLSPNTIKTHIRCIYRKLGVCTRAAAITRYSPPQARPGRHASLPEPLTGRETEVLGLLRGSLSTRGIAAELSLSPNTIKTQTQAIYRKLGVSTRAAAITRARDIGLLRPGGGEQQRHEAYSGQGSWAAQASA
jgi:ATP/maltotriose-dependent transcriptional regulator MalT